MKIIRRGTFETNSSSTHSITMCSGNEYDAWMAGELYFVPNDETFLTEKERLAYGKRELIRSLVITDRELGTLTYNGVTVEYDRDNFSDRRTKLETFLTKENIDAISDEEAENYLADMGFWEEPVTYDEYDDYISDYYESFKRSYEISDTERVVAFGYYGHD